MTNEEGALEDISYDNFKKLYNKWHAILGQTFLGCLESKEYIHTRAGLILLSRVVNVFPTRPVLGEKIMDALAPLKDDTNRQDLRSMALGYSSQLIKARDEGVWEEDLAQPRLVAKRRRRKPRSGRRPPRNNSKRCRKKAMLSTGSLAAVVGAIGTIELVQHPGAVVLPVDR